jgi:transposase
MDDTLFDIPASPAVTHDEGRAIPRVQRPDRAQLALRATDLDGLLPPDHGARLVWEFVLGLDLQPLYDRIKAIEGGVGRPPIDPAILTALWVYATLDGVGSARALDRLCDAHDAYRWLCGGVSVNHHTLADFRVGHGALFDRLLTASVAALIAEGHVSLTRVAQDGVRVRTSAGAKSFRGRDALGRALAEAEERVATLRRELDDDPAATTRRVTTARERAATERLERVRKALARMPELDARRASRRHLDQKRRPPEASTTDPDASYMKFADGGFRPGYNIQFASDTSSQVIVGIGVAQESDQRQLGPMVDQLMERYARAPDEYLVDGGYINLADLTRVTGAPCGTTVFMPLTRRGSDPHAPHKGDTPEVLAWRVRMATDEAKAIYKLRGQTAECVNAIARNRGLTTIRVRGLERVRASIVWFALAHNLMRGLTLRTAALHAASPSA